MKLSGFEISSNEKKKCLFPLFKDGKCHLRTFDIHNISSIKTITLSILFYLFWNTVTIKCNNIVVIRVVFTFFFSMKIKNRNGRPVLLHHTEPNLLLGKSILYWQVSTFTSKYKNKVYREIFSFLGETKCVNICIFSIWQLFFFFFFFRKIHIA